MKKPSILLSLTVLTLGLCLCSCAPDVFRVEKQIRNLPENEGCRIEQWPDAPQEFIVVRRDGSIWRYRSSNALGLQGIRDGTLETSGTNLRNEDLVFEARR